MCSRKLVSLGYRVAINKGEISTQMLSQTKVFVLLSPNDNLKPQERKALKKYLKYGGRILVTATVIRIHRLPGYHYPKEAVITDGIVNDAIYSLEQNFHGGNLTFCKNFRYLYPYGCTLNADKESIVLLSTGSACFPFNRPTCAFYKDAHSNGRIIALGSSMGFSDCYINKEKNMNLFGILFKLLVEDDVELNIADLQCPDIVDHVPIPDIRKLSEFPYTCLQESDETPTSMSLIFRSKLYQFDNRHFSKILSAYKDLNLTRKKLRIIKPKFEAPLPELKPALVPPRFRGLPNPNLELMDLDECFVSPTAKLNELSSKCNDNDLEFYIKEFGNILRAPSNINNNSAKQILEYVCSQLVPLKRNCF
ncbi:Intraflagellar transport protein 52 like protein [Argiope bruennichi]|uniref:Intraflagellar transport protein 52 like protein n=1 Tax=Argiope bruennichi TaxID=94029 RepID=A0A8T0EDV2_ARGBR|nr:Intraflagellar transport protein 52 like protein [Argiope bruennichi]